MDTKNKGKLNIGEVRTKLGAADQGYWKSLDEVVKSDEYQKWMDDEFPERASIPDIDRRSFLKFAGVSLALAGLAGCRNLPQEKIVPYVKTPEEIVPGKSLYYASAFTHNGYATGVLVESHEGRPTKIEGNPDHPASLGSIDAFGLASMMHLYDPDRNVPVIENTLPSTWEAFFVEARKVLKGAKVRVLTETITSPAEGAALQSFIAAFPGSQWHQWQPVNRDNALGGATAAFGQAVETIYHFDKATRIVSLDADFLTGMPGSVRYAREFSLRRDLDSTEEVSRVYAFQSSPNLVGANADHSWSIRPSQMEAVAYGLASRLGVSAPSAGPSGVSDKVLDSIAADLKSAGGSGVIVPGEHLSPSVHAVCHAINQAIGAVGTTVEHIAPVAVRPEINLDSLTDLVGAMNAGQVDALIILGGNPVYNAPADLKFKEALGKVKNSWRLGLYYDETSQGCRWHLPQAHYLEAWGDTRSYDGTVAIVQPLIKPLFDGKSIIELMNALAGKPGDSLDFVKSAYVKAPGHDADKAWREVLNTGVVPGTKSAPITVQANPTGLSSSKAGSGLEVVFLPDPTVWDGCYANNGWLQELPKPLTKLTWDNAVHLSPKTAEALGVVSEDKVTVKSGSASVTAPVWIQPGHADDVVTLHLGYGRPRGGKVSDGTGFDFGVLRSSSSLYTLSQVQVEKAGGKYALASSQMHHSMEGRDLIREGSVAQYKLDPTLKPEGAHDLSDPKTKPYYNLTEDWAKETGHEQWGMTIDLNSCIGCNACVIACQTENNIPTVGKIEVARGRELHWIRVDRYYRITEGAESRDIRDKGFKNLGPIQVEPPDDKIDTISASNFQTVFQPIPCMQCEVAPCEPVCPVAATVHSHEGLNQMVYNRCVGTRYCSNNCPYKVRRFNYHNYQIGQSEQVGPKPYGQRNFQGEKDMPLLRMINNPNVTVRSRGVMEKCTYCVQRINQVRIDAKKEGRGIRDGEIVTACEQACPAKAITFGNIADKNTRVSKKKQEARNYSLLEHLNTVPRTTYLGKVRNPNPEVLA